MRRRALLRRIFVLEGELVSLRSHVDVGEHSDGRYFCDGDW